MPVSIRLGSALEERLTRASRRFRVNKTEVIKRSRRGAAFNLVSS
jgi:hypothetical protein